MNLLRRLIHAVTGRHYWQYESAEVVGSGRVYGPWIRCTVCSTTQKALDEPPADHPDSMTAELPPEQEEWLAAVDEDLWPRAAA